MSVLAVWTMEKIGAQCRCTTGSKLPEHPQLVGALIWPRKRVNFTRSCSTAPHRVCWSSDATDSKAISESPLSYIPGDKSSTSIPIFTALSPAEH